MKRIVFLLLLAPVLLVAQKPLLIEGTAPGFYITHSVAPKENYYSIGRMYNISPKEIAPFNNLQLEKGLSLNQVIKVPLNAGNFSQDGQVSADEALVPVYHTVKEKEGLYRIATSYNKLPLETLRKWNNIKGDAVANGTKLVVGYLKVKKELSPLAGAAKTVVPVTTPVAEPVVKKEEKPAPPEQKPVVKKEEPAVVVKKEDKPVVTAPVKKADPPPVVKKEEKPVVSTTEPATAAPSKAGSKGNGGFFKGLYNDQSRGGDLTTENGTVGIFKSSSGWEDGKYYCLHNNATPGTILKITYPATGKSIYAKVLDAMPDIKQNTGILVRLSNAAASELGADENGKFEGSVSYTK